MKKRVRVALVRREHVPGSPDRYNPADLDFIKGMISEAFDLSIGGIDKLVAAGDSILIKINLVEGNPPEKGVTTDPRMLHALIDLLYDAGASKIKIGA
jgi:uncharacterized protein (DUF362 family)